MADYGSSERIDAGSDRELSSTNKAVEDAIAAAESAARPGAGTSPLPAVDASADDDAPPTPPPAPTA